SVDIVGENEKVTKLLEKLATIDKEPEIAAEAWVALLATGQAPPMPANDEVAILIQWQCGRVLDDLRDPAIRFANRPEVKIEDGIEEKADYLWSVLNRWLPTLPEAHAVGVFRLVMQGLAEATHEPV